MRYAGAKQTGFRSNEVSKSHVLSKQDETSEKRFRGEAQIGYVRKKNINPVIVKTSSCFKRWSV